MTTTADVIVGERVLLALHRRKMSKRALAEILDVSDASVGKKINGFSTFSLDELLMLAKVFEMPVTELLPGDDYEPVLTGRGRKGRGHLVAVGDGIGLPRGMSQTALRLAWAAEDDADLTDAGRFAIVLPFRRRLERSA